MDSTTAKDLLDLALRSTRGEFVVACPFRLLLGESALVRPEGPQPTSTGLLPLSARHAGDDETPPLLLGVRKASQNFPSMVTVGRTANNDIVIPDVNVSKFHAFFRLAPGRIELTDAGSRNGTWLNGRPLVAKGPAHAVAAGDAVRFGQLGFTVLDAASAWDRVNRTSDW